MRPVSISGSAPSRRTPSTMTTAPTTSRITPLTRAARISARCQPKVHLPRAGRAAIQVAASAKPSPALGDTLCPAPASRASEPDSQPPIAWASMTVAVSRKAASRRGRWAAAAVRWWSWDISAPAQLVEARVVDAEVMGDLVHHGDRDLLDDFLAALTDPQGGAAEDGDPVGQRAGGPPVVALGQRGALIQAREVRLAHLGRRRVLDEDGGVVHLGRQLRWHQVESVAPGVLELRSGHLHHAPHHRPRVTRSRTAPRSEQHHPASPAQDRTLRRYRQ